MNASGVNQAPWLVLDTHVCLELFVFDDPRLRELRLALSEQRVRAVSDTACRDEWRRVLGYPQLRLSAGRQAQACRDYDHWLQPLPDRQRRAPLPLPRCRDPDDQMLLELAQASAAAGLLSRDREVLRLAGRCQRAAGFRILPPEQWQALLPLDAA